MSSGGHSGPADATGRHTLNGVLAEGQEGLGDRGSSARLETELLMMEVLGRSRAELYARPELPVDASALARFQRLIRRRRAGEPVAYILGRREFWSLELEVTPATLIPRPETEHVVELSLGLLPADDACRIVDLGTGCGAIALALAKERPGWHVTATDESPSALAVASANARRLGLHNVSLALGDWGKALKDDSFELIVSNPPYVPSGDPHLREGDLRFEPRQALVGGKDGLVSLRRVVADARRRLCRGGWLVLEHGHDQAGDVVRLLEAAGFRDVTHRRDLAGHLRVTAGRRATAR